jgi:exosortase/archaeosortase family protein
MDMVVEYLQQGSAVLSYYLFRGIGIRSSVSLLILTLVGANLYLRSGWNKLLLVMAVIPLALFKNAIRIVTLCVLSIYVNPDFLRGSLHRKGGVVFFLISMVVLIPVVILMQRLERNRGLPPAARELRGVLQNAGPQ